MSESVGAKSKEKLAFELMLRLIAADDIYQQELKIYSECVRAVGGSPTTECS